MADGCGMIPYYQDEHVTLYHGDWRDYLDDLADSKADLAIADPPYGETSIEWDHWPDGWPALAAQIAPAMWCWGSMRMFLERADEFKPWKFSQDLVWEKHNGSSFHTDRFKRVHELVTHWYQGSWSDIHHWTPTTADATPRTVRRKARPKHTGNIEASSYQSFDGGPRLMRSVLYSPSAHGKAIHPTQKPTGYTEHLIAYGCPPGGLVLDLFAGSCSTAVAARTTGRRCISFETREDYCEQAARRLAQNVLDFSGGVA